MKANVALLAMMTMTLGLTGYMAATRSGPVEGDNGERLAAIEDRLRSVEGLLEDVNESNRSLKRRVESASRSAAPRGISSGAAPAAAGGGEGGSPGDAALGAADGEFRDEVASRVESAVAAQMERMAARQQWRDDEGKWKPPMSAVAREFGFNEQQESVMRDEFNSARDSAYALLSERRGDGSTILDDLADDIKTTGELGPAVGRFFVKLASENVPGRNETYLSAFGTMEEQIHERIESHLDENGRRLFRELKIDVFEVDTGYDPIGDHIRERIGEEL